ncbi:MAG: hypothetical protein LBO73_02250 [Holosporaceae bacterium]|jgi:hypothetical protein|nr:hypothetical protein [Holosporaceae bacterium]
MNKFLMKNSLILYIFLTIANIEGMNSFPLPDFGNAERRNPQRVCCFFERDTGPYFYGDPAEFFGSDYEDPRSGPDRGDNGAYLCEGSINQEEAETIKEALREDPSLILRAEDRFGRTPEEILRIRAQNSERREQLKVISPDVANEVIQNILRVRTPMLNEQLRYLSENDMHTIGLIYLKTSQKTDQKVYVGKTKAKLFCSTRDISEELLIRFVEEALEKRESKHHVKNFNPPILLSYAFSPEGCAGGEHFWIRFFQSFYFNLRNRIDAVGPGRKPGTVAQYFSEQSLWPEDFERILGMLQSCSPIIHVNVRRILGNNSPPQTASPTRMTFRQRIPLDGSRTVLFSPIRDFGI